MSVHVFAVSLKVCVIQRKSIVQYVVCSCVSLIFHHTEKNDVV